MRTVRWIVLTLIASATGCSCSHRSQQIFSKDATPVVTPNPVVFQDVPVGASVQQEVTLANQGEIELDVSNVSLVQPADAGPQQFLFGDLTNLSAPFGKALQPGDKATIALVCRPSQAGNAVGSLVIQSNSSATPKLSVPLQCSSVSVDIVVKPPVIDFGNVQVQTSAQTTATLTNLGSSTSQPITLSPVSGTQASEFSYTGTGQALAPNASLALNVTFTPTALGQASASIQYQYCPTCTPQNISLTGVGVDCQLVYNPDPVQFFGVPAGSSSSTTVTLVNVGTADCQVSSLGMYSGASGPFAVSALSAPLPATIAPDATLSFTLTYTASQAGNDSDQIVANYVSLDTTGKPAGPPNRTANDPVSGNGTLNPCSLTIKPPSINFGYATLNTALTNSVALTNQGQQNCSISGIALGSGTDPAFTLVDPTTTSFTLTPGQSQSIAVQCDVTNGGTPLLRRGTLTFQTTDSNQPNVNVPLTTYIKGSGNYASGWPKWHYDNTDQGQSPADTSGNQGTLVWQFRVGVPQTAGGESGLVNPNPSYLNSPVVDEYGNVYQLGMDGTFWALDPGGNELWSATLDAPNPDEHPATPIIASDDTIFIESGTDGADVNGGQLYHLDAKTGQVLSSASPPTQQSCYAGQCASADGFDVNPSIGNDGLLYDGDDFGQVVTYSRAASGGGFTQANTVILPFYGERVAVALDDSNDSFWCSLNVCFGVNPSSAGFTQMAAWPSTGAPIGSAAGAGVALSTWTNSDLAWDKNHTGWLIVEAGMQTGGSGNTEVVAMDPKNGSLHWDVTLPSGNTPGSWNSFTEQGIFSSDVGNSSPAIATFQGQPNDGVAYVGNVDGLHALDVNTGKEKAGWPFKTSSDVDSAPAIGGDGTIFFGTADGTFYAVNPDGSQRYAFKAQGRISSSPAIGPDGTVYFVADDGQLYAVR